MNNDINNEYKDVIKILWEYNKKHLEYVIKNDWRLTCFKKWSQFHHIIPTKFELIPNLVIKWTIEFLLSTRIKKYERKWFRVNEKTLYVNNEKWIMLKRKTHKLLHDFLEIKKKELYKNLWILEYYNEIVSKLEQGFLPYYADRWKYQKKLKKYTFFSLNSYSYTDFKNGINNTWNNRKKREKIHNDISNKIIKTKEILKDKRRVYLEELFIDKIPEIVSNKYDYRFNKHYLSEIRNKYISFNWVLKSKKGPSKFINNELYDKIINSNKSKIKRINNFYSEIFKEWQEKLVKKVSLFLDDKTYEVYNGIEVLSLIDKDNYNQLKYNFINKTEYKKLVNEIV